MMRITRPQLFMEIAHSVAKRSTCYRLNVGAVCVVNNSIVSIGYNGAPAGKEHCRGNECPGRFECKETIHAEYNALKRISTALIANKSAIDLYCTDSPCMLCASAALDIYHIKRLFFSRLYRINDHLDLMCERGVEIYQVTPAGYMIDWNDRKVMNIA
jgi:dCMP deaminase